MNKLRAWMIHKLGGFTRAEMENCEREWRKEVSWWKHRYNDLVNEYGRIETITVKRTLDRFRLHEYQWMITNEMLKDLFDQIREKAGRLVERTHCDDAERNLRTVTMSIKLIRNEVIK